METMSNAFGGDSWDVRGKKERKEKQLTEKVAPANNVVLSNGKFPRVCSYRHIWKVGLLLFLLLLLSRLANVASRSAICQTRLKICTVGSPVIIAEAYRWKEKRITVRERKNKNERWRRNWDEREKKFSGDIERQRRKRQRRRNRIALVYRSGFWTILSLIEKRKSREGGIERKNDNIVTRDANLVGTLMDDPATTMKLDRRTFMNWRRYDTIAKLCEKSFRTDWVALTYIRTIYVLK